MGKREKTTTTSSTMLSSLNAATLLTLLFTAPKSTLAWGNNGGDANYAIFGNRLDRDWLYQAEGINIVVHGCLWSYMTDKDDEDAGCLEESSEDGTEVWYMMSNCRRAQVVWSVYASGNSNNPSCNSNNFKESFVTTTSAMDFVYYIENSGLYSFTDDGYGGQYPQCGGGDGDNNNNGGNLVGLSCTNDAAFQLEQFNDYYCLTRTGEQADDLYTFNQDMSNLNCINVYANQNYNGDDDDNGGGGELIQYLMSVSDSCSSADSGLCGDSEAAQERQSYASHSGNGMFSHTHVGTGTQSWFTKLKYVTGGLLLLASFVMFTGILFTNRRRRRALMQRKYRQAKRNGRNSSDRSRRSSRSASKHRDSASRKSSSRSRRSKSRDPNRSSPSRSSPKKSEHIGEAEGVLT